MRNPVTLSLREAVRDEIAHAFDVVGFAKPRDIARLVCAGHPEEIQAIGTQLAEDALTSMARGEIKKNNPIADSTQIPLPGMPEALRANLPPAISIPVAHSEEDDDEVIFKPLASSSLADLEAHLVLLSSQIQADTRRYRALKELRDLAVAAGAEADSLVLHTIALVGEVQ